MKFSIVKPKISQSEFLKMISDHFPETTEEINDPDYEGLIYIQVGILAKYTNDCIAKYRMDEVQKVFQFFDTVIAKVDSETENALFVSFLEHLEMDGVSQREKDALKLLPRKFQAIYQGLRN